MSRISGSALKSVGPVCRVFHKIKIGSIPFRVMNEMVTSSNCWRMHNEVLDSLSHFPIIEIVVCTIPIYQVSYQLLLHWLISVFEIRVVIRIRKIMFYNERKAFVS